jgi:hypothetical protein
VWVLLLAAALVAAPAAVLRGLCAGRSCDRPARAGTDAPFCSLPDETRALVSAGFREGRSPEVLAVTGRFGAYGGAALSAGGPAWPSIARPAEVPLVLWGTGVARAELAEGIGLDRLAPTLARVIGLDRPHPEVRSGAAIDGIATGARPRLVLLVVWSGVGAQELAAEPQAWPILRRLMDEGAATASAHGGSLPQDPAAVATTIGTGGLPHQHGVTGTLVRRDDGRLVRAWGPGAPPYVIATLADDIDELGGSRPLTGLAAHGPSLRGLVGSGWYLDGDSHDVSIGRRPTSRAIRLLGRGYGRDGATDLLAVAERGGLRALDRRLERLVAAARRAAGGSLAVAVTATGSPGGGPGALPAAGIVDRVEAVLGAPGVIEAAAVGGLFLDDDRLAARGLSSGEVAQALSEVTAPSGSRLFRDAFPALSVAFGRYC